MHQIWPKLKKGVSTEFSSPKVTPEVALYGVKLNENPYLQILIFLCIFSLIPSFTYSTPGEIIRSKALHTWWCYWWRLPMLQWPQALHIYGHLRVLPETFTGVTMAPRYCSFALYMDLTSVTYQCYNGYKALHYIWTLNSVTGDTYRCYNDSQALHYEHLKVIPVTLTSVILAPRHCIII